MIRRAAVLCLGIAAALMLFAAYFGYRSASDSPSLTADDTLRKLGPMAVGEHALVTRLNNAGSRPLHVTIPAGSCGTNACFTCGTSAQVITLGPRESIDLQWTLDVRQAGPFTTGIRLLAWGDRTETLSVVVEGFGVTAGGTGNDDAAP